MNLGLHLARWNLVPDGEPIETPSSLLLAVRHNGRPAMLKIAREAEERRGGALMTWWNGDGAAKGGQTTRRGAGARIRSHGQRVIRAMPFVWIGIGEKEGGHRQRDYVERNAIALLSNFGKAALDPPSCDWLGAHCKSEKVTRSGPRNDKLVSDASYDPGFIDCFRGLVKH